MKELSRKTRSQATRYRLVVAPALSLALIAATATAAAAAYAASLKVEAERSPNGAKLTFNGKGFPANGRIKITGTRPPGGSGRQEFGTYSADAEGNFKGSKLVPCSTQNADDTQEQVTVMAADSASGASASVKVGGGAWQCQ